MFSVDGELVKERICDFRKMTRVTQQELAIYLGMGRGSYQSRESNGNFDWEQIEQIADYFNVSPFFIQYGVEEDELRTIAKVIRESGGLHQPMYTIFDNLSKQVEIAKLYSSFLNLDQIHQKRIKRHIEIQGY